MLERYFNYQHLNSANITSEIVPLSKEAIQFFKSIQLDRQPQSYILVGITRGLVTHILTHKPPNEVKTTYI
ncbi:MAG: hypothetical protein QM666_07530 [Acinetobacter sp.]